MAVTTPQRELILAAFETELAKITTKDDAYRTDIGLITRRDRALDEFNNSDFPLLHVAGGGEEGSYHGIVVLRRMKVIVSGAVKWNEVDEADGPSVKLEELIRDVEETIFDDPRLGVTDVIDTVQESIETDEGVLTPYAGFTMHFTVHYYREETAR